MNPAIAVTFIQPDGAPWTDASAISGADSDSPVEVLHLDNITSADVGTWTDEAHRAGGPGQPAGQRDRVLAGRGAGDHHRYPRASTPGKPIAVKLTVLGPTGPITDPATLKSLLVGVTATGQRAAEPGQGRVNPVGGPTGSAATRARYTAPSQPTTLTITGTAAGYGLYATQIPATVAVGAPNTGFIATPHFPGASQRAGGRRHQRQRRLHQPTGAAKQVLLKLTASGANAAISPDPTGAVHGGSGNPPSVPFTVTVAKYSHTGPGLARGAGGRRGQPVWSTTTGPAR